MVKKQFKIQTQRTKIQNVTKIYEILKKYCCKNSESLRLCMYQIHTILIIYTKIRKSMCFVKLEPQYIWNHISLTMLYSHLQLRPRTKWHTLYSLLSPAHHMLNDSRYILSLYFQSQLSTDWKSKLFYLSLTKFLTLR